MPFFLADGALVSLAMDTYTPLGLVVARTTSVTSPFALVLWYY
jgi:hypothetical protein